VDAVREYFLLAKAEALTTKVPVAVRGEVARDLTVARQKREAAEMLWLGGSTSEALKLARDAFELVAGASERAGGPNAAPAEPSKEIVATRAAIAKQPMPEIDAEVTSAHGSLFTELVSTHDALSSRIAVVGMSTKDVSERRRRRAFGAFVAALGAGLVVWLLVRTPLVIRPEASAAYSDKFPATKIVDGRPEGEWLLPDGQTGWIDLHISPGRKIKAIKLLNAHNGPFNDRATKDFHIDAYGADNKILKSLDGSFPEFLDAPQWQRLPFEVTGAEKIRIEIRSFHKLGGGLAEVELE
jgi:hypothetical protein